ncbi:MAG: RodZ domain-containing protein [Pseudomonadota bacterium]
MSSEDNSIEAGEVDESADTEIADAVPAGVGETLRAARESKRLTLDLVAAETRIPKRHLETIERGDFDALPARTYAIGFARSYARAVDLDESAIADQVREEMGAASPRYSSVGQGMEPGDPAKLPSKGLVWFGAIAALVLMLGVVSFASTYFGAGEGPASLLAGMQSEEEEPEAVAAQAPDPVEEAALSPEGQVVFTALEDGVWVRFYEDEGERLFEAQMASGDTFEVPLTATEPLINTGRPDAFAITINGREVPKLADEPVTMGDTPISAAALLARAEG